MSSKKKPGEAAVAHFVTYEVVGLVMFSAEDITKRFSSKVSNIVRKIRV